jgi:hypothetical protein
MKSVFHIKTESGLTAALAAYCEANKLPNVCANELLADCHRHVVWLASFIDQWEKVQGANDRLAQTLLEQGFGLEQGGGGCVILSRYMESGACIWATCIDGGGLPESDNWMVCTYGDDIGDILFEASSESDLTLEQTIDQALIVANNFWPADALCRNGKLIADCDCC